jgi:hypothetical protein
MISTIAENRLRAAVRGRASVLFRAGAVQVPSASQTLPGPRAPNLPLTRYHGPDKLGPLGRVLGELE